MKGKLLIGALLGAIILALLSLSLGSTPILNAGFVVCFLVFLYAVSNLGEKRSGKRLNKTRPKTF